MSGKERTRSRASDLRREPVVRYAAVAVDAALGDVVQVGRDEPAVDEAEPAGELALGV